MSEKSDRTDHFAWVDDIIRRWPVILCVFASLGWVTKMQWTQSAQAEELKKISGDLPVVAEKVDDMSTKLDAVLLALGYEVKTVAIKKENNNVNLPSN